MRPLFLLACLTFAAPAQATGCDPDCLRTRLQTAMRQLLGTVPDPARQAEIMTTQVLWQAYRDMQCGLDTACQQRQTRWRLEELETAVK